MSSHYRPTRKTQKTPKFCFRKKPIIARMIPCEHGPNIGQSPTINLQVKPGSTGPGEGLVVSAPMPIDAPHTAYHLVAYDTAGYFYDIYWSIDCPNRKHSLTIASSNPAFALRPYGWSDVNFPPKQKNCDTGWHGLQALGGVGSTPMVARIFL